MRGFLVIYGQFTYAVNRKPIFRELAYFEKDPPMLLIQFYFEDHRLAIARSFVRKDNEIIVEQNFFVLPVEFRNQGIGKSIGESIFHSIFRSLKF